MPALPSPEPDGKEGVSGSSPPEGSPFRELPANQLVMLSFCGGRGAKVAKATGEEAIGIAPCEAPNLGDQVLGTERDASFCGVQETARFARLSKSPPTPGERGPAGHAEAAGSSATASTRFLGRRSLARERLQARRYPPVGTRALRYSEIRCAAGGSMLASTATT